MKRKVLLLFAIVANLLSCEPNVSTPLSWSFENGRVKIIVEGTQENWAEPWQPVISIYVDGALISTQPGLPVFLSKFDRENIHVEWQKEKRGVITFTQRDGEEKQLVLPRLSSLLD